MKTFLSCRTGGLLAACALMIGVTGCKAPGKKTAQTPPTSAKPSQPTVQRPAQAQTGPLGRQSSYGRVNTHLPFVALTFDDGPHPTNTPRLLDILRQKNVKATFFVVGTNARKYPHILKRMVAEGHEIGNHTISHGKITTMPQPKIHNEIVGSQHAVTSATGVAPRCFRPPYGAITSQQKGWIKGNYGLPSILWSVDPEDWKKPGVGVVAQRLVSGAAPGGILLLHDIHAPSIDATPIAIDRIKAKGLQFVTVSQLISMEPR
ncbi:MAG: polysaccharide deacetylase family protein [Verrucomicrobiota bacterium]